MLYVALAEAAALLLVVLAFVGLVRSMSRAHARREDLLLNQMLHLAGKPWQSSPSDESRLEIWKERSEEARDQRRQWTTNPEQAI